MLEYGYYPVDEICDAMAVSEMFFNAKVLEGKVGTPFFFLGENHFFCRDLARFIERNRADILHEQERMRRLGKELL